MSASAPAREKPMVNVDLKSERDKCSFKIEELTNYIDEGAKYTQMRRKLEELVLSDKTFVDPIPEEYLSHVQKYENAIRKAVRYYRLMDSIKLDVDNDLIWTSMETGVANAVFKDNPPLGLHFILFIPTIEQQGTKEQQEYWLKRAKNNEINGTFAQTELGHGTFIRGLETSAHYDPKTEEFIIHSPQLSSYKWWPGGLGQSANYCIVMARLFTQGKDCGIKPFIVQIRDENTHLPLPGIKVGELGAKLGYNTVNSGFLGFEHVRIPREQMLMKLSQVLKDGTFVPAKNDKLAYGSMIFVRVTIVASMAKHLAKASTIAIRYSAVRKQSQIQPDKPEVQIIEFVTQQHKLFIPLASSFAFLVCARWLRDMYVRMREETMQGDSRGLPQIHALSCCFKAISTFDASRFVEQCRLACGGHGYMLSSSLPFIYGLATAAVTYEGENTVLLLQTARCLVKTWNEHSKGKTPTEVEAYLFKNSSPHKWENTVDGIVRGFQRVAAGKLEACVKNLQRLVKQGLSYEDAWNQISVRLVALAESHCRAVVLRIYASKTAAASQRLSAPLSTVLHQLVHLYALYWALERTGDLLTYTSISGDDISTMRCQYEEVLTKLRPNAVGIVDAFDLRDEVLQSTLGAYDGRVYERLMEEALKSPLNQEPVNQSFHQYLKPFMQGKL